MSRVWTIHVAVGSTGCGVLSLPSKGIPIVLVPFFLTAGLMCAVGSIGTQKIHTVCTGLGLLIVASWTRAIALWGLDQQGVGSTMIASFVWAWIAGAAILLMIAVWTRGLT